MELELTSRQRQLVDERNELVDSTLQKYRLAGQIAQTGLAYVLALLKSPKHADKTVGEICRLGDLFLHRATASAFKKNVEEKGIALPVQIEKGTFASGVAPEENDSFQAGTIYDEDLVKITLGVHIDGYTAQVSRTITVVRPDEREAAGKAQEPLEGPEADALIAAYLATEAVLALLSLSLNTNNHPLIAETGPVTGTRIRKLVETVASEFRTQVAPGSRVRRVRRFLAGQSDAVRESDLKGVIWDEELEEDRLLDEVKAAYNRATKPEQSQDQAEDWEEVRPGDDFEVVPGEVWLVDIRMAATGGEKGVLKYRTVLDSTTATAYKPSIYARDYTVSYGLKLKASKNLLSKADNFTSVYPFKLSYLADDDNELKSHRLGLNEVVQHHLFVPQPIEAIDFIPIDAYQHGSVSAKKAASRSGQPVVVAREMTTVVLIPASQSQSGFGESIRLTGGNKVAPPSWLHSKYEVHNDEVLALLKVPKEPKISTGISFQVVQASKLTDDILSFGETAPAGGMEID
ncbi:Arx1p [Sugiyamaella lignohabitans]|uniref:Probable metalloprotease ARX1 n=1 Tax=Sugiyamaella lignohabitans TaxID=796027 RepID=A0A161HHD2_9ASCO|nr:Arx1p [Sugiyamaella lignohabitans]ANB11527.1 Arx1p [Sugiyamaella lignohabitans]